MKFTDKFFIGAFILFLCGTTVWAEGARVPARPSYSKKILLRDKLNDINVPIEQPRNIELKTMSDTGEPDTSISEEILAEQRRKNSAENKTFKHLGEFSDPVFYLDTDIVLNYEKKIDLPKINIVEYRKYFILIKELFNKKLYERTIVEIDNLQKSKLFADERIKLNFIKAECLLNLMKNDEVPALINAIEQYDLSKRFEADRFFLNAKYNEQINQQEVAISEYLKVYHIHPRSSVADDALFKTAQLLLNKKEYQNVFNYCDIIINNYPYSDYADNSIYLKAQLYDTNTDVKDFMKSEACYRKLYNNYPKSEFAGESQKRADYIRRNFL